MSSRTEDREERTRSHYERRIEEFEEGHEIHDWESRESQYARFAVLADEVDLTDARLLDVGCGVGDLFEYLHLDRRIPLSYTGVDLLESMVARARDRFPHARFIAADLTTSHPLRSERFDVSYCSGTFNLRIGDHEAFARTMLSILAELSVHRLVFNMLHVRSPARDARYCYFEPSEVVQWPEIAPLSPRVVEGYLPNDFTVICTK